MLATVLLFTTSMDANSPWFTQYSTLTEHIWLSTIARSNFTLQHRSVAKVKIFTPTPPGRPMFRFQCKTKEAHSAMKSAQKVINTEKASLKHGISMLLTSCLFKQAAPSSHAISNWICTHFSTFCYMRLYFHSASGEVRLRTSTASVNIVTCDMINTHIHKS